MAGIGFELRKIYSDDSVGRSVLGAMYSTLVTVGPTIIVVGTILLMYLVLEYSNVGYQDRELLSSTILYVFIFAVILTAPFNAIFSRYLADKIYCEQPKDILPSFFSGIAILSVLGTVIAAPIMLSLYFRGGVDPYYIFASYLLWMEEIFLLFGMTYLYATKDYKVIALSFIFGMASALGISYLLHFVFGLETTRSILYGLTIGTFFAACLNGSYICYFFRDHSNNYSECLSYIKKFFPIFIANLLYFGGLYVHNFVFWTIPGRIVVAETYISMQPYDMATCLALFTDISTIIIFTVMAETKFHVKFQSYTAALNGGTLKRIKKEKESMFFLLMKQISLIFGLQIIITILFYLLIKIFAPSFGFGGMTLEIYPSLAVAYLVIFLMYGNMVYLFYFNDNRGAFYTGFIFFVCGGLGAWLSKDLSVAYYGLGILVGSIIGWTYTFFRIRYMEKHFEEHIFCKQKIVEVRQVARKNNDIIYSKKI